MKRSFARMLPMLLSLLLAMLPAAAGSGCTGRETTAATTSADQTRAASVTAFGTVQCGETLNLILPFAVTLLEIEDQENLEIPPQTAVLKIDLERLRQEQEIIGQKLASAQIELAGEHQRQEQLIQADILELGLQYSLREPVLSGEMINGIGYFREDGVLVTAGRPLLLEYACKSEQIVAAGETLLVLGCLDTLEILVPVEEQLINGVQAGADVQISPMYDQTVVWIGQVRRIADQAVTVNGETMVQVWIQTEEKILGPGYNVVVKFLHATG